MGKVVVITGASSGMGFETLKTLVEEGETVYGTGRKDEDLEKIREVGGLPLKVEMTEFKSIDLAVSKVIDEQSRIDVLINNAGYGLYGAVEEVPVQIAKHQFEVNLFGLAKITQLVIPHMRNNGSGTIINISSMGGKIYTPFGAWYHATKHALEGWSDCLRLELKAFNIKVVIIEPGAIHTPWSNLMHDNLMKYSGNGPYAKIVKKMADTTTDAYKKSSPPSVVAKAVSKAINSKNPKTRYAVGKNAKLLIFIRTKLGDRLFDKLISRMIS